MKPNLEDISESFPRRQILKTALTFVTGLTATSLVSFFIPRSTKPAQAIVVQRPNEFELQGEGTYIKYSILNGLPQLDYKTEKISLHFSGGKIQTLATDIGTLITVIISKPPNPDQTQAILTTQETTGFIKRPLFGQLQSYQGFVLKGTATYR